MDTPSQNGRRPKWLRPNLGILIQHPPRPAALPGRYFKVKKLLQPAPRISIVTPTYNYGHFLERTLKSVIGQGYPHLEHIIQDGGSTDDTLELVEKYRHRIKHFESRPDHGQAHAINLGFRHATGEIMAYLNSDDVLLPGTLSYVANYFSRHANIDVIYGHRLIIDESDMVIGEWCMPAHDRETLRWTDFVPQETVFWRRRIWDKVGGALDESFQFAMDWDLLLRFQAAGAVFRRLPRYLAAFRVHARQKTTAQISRLGDEEIARLRLRNFGRVVTLAEVRSHTRAFLSRSIWHRWLHKLTIIKDRFLACLGREGQSANWCI
jgi:glycosyltransferase involved in cell wall biosynthesis